MKDDTDRPDNDACEPRKIPLRPPDGTPNRHPNPQAIGALEPARNVLRKPTPLHHHSLRGDGQKLLARAIDTKPLLGEFVMHGQATMIYAKANSGKTLSTLRLVLDAIEAGQVEANDLLYFNADDSGKGLAEKVELMERCGAHMLAPGYKGLKVSQFADKMKQAAEDGSARGRVVIIDTLKKVTSLMDKGRSSEFAQVCREFVMAGGTVIALGHTAKNPNPDGTPRYQGTTDILEDFDAVYIAEPLVSGSGGGERIIRFTKEKARADSPQVVAYAYSTEAGLSYEDKVWSLRLVYPEEMNGLHVEDVDDNYVIDAIRGYLASGHGHLGQDKIVRAASVDGDISRAQAERVLIKYCGSNPEKHLWNFSKGDRGKRTYFLLARPKNPRPQD